MTAQQLREKFEIDLAKLQEDCKHEESEWMPSELAPGHIFGSVKICNICEKVMERS